MAEVVKKRDRFRNTKDQENRFDYAVDRFLNSGTLAPYMDDFWRYVDGEITWEEFDERTCS